MTATASTLSSRHSSAYSSTASRSPEASWPRIPNGVYHAEDVIDGDGVSDEPLPIVVSVTVGDDWIHADFTGCAPQAAGPVNCSTGALLSACKTVVRAITAPQARSNDGFFAPFSLTIPPRTVFSAESPAPTGWYYEGAAFANDLFWKALAPACPDRLGAGSYTSLCCSYIVGTDRATDELFVLAEPNVGGWGGSALGDGESALIATTDGDTYNFPVEVVESRFPVLVERYELNVGCRRGRGAGTRRLRRRPRVPPPRRARRLRLRLDRRLGAPALVARRRCGHEQLPRVRARRRASAATGEWRAWRSRTVT